MRSRGRVSPRYVNPWISQIGMVLRLARAGGFGARVTFERAQVGEIHGITYIGESACCETYLVLSGLDMDGGEAQICRGW